jgi:TPP-dependent pyruvate/acetoin dehydrogenase alpha subunit
MSGTAAKELQEPNTLARIFRSLYRIRRVEEEIARVYPTDKIKSPVHLSIGQEAVSVGVCEALVKQDVVFGSYRGHALYLAKGGDLKKMIAELFGKVTGCARGKGGSMHLIDVEQGMMGSSAVVGTTIPEAVGYAYAMKVQDKSSLVVSFFGDGAVEEGCFHESMNFARLKEVPIIFICENNLYAIHSHIKNRQALDNMCERAKGYGIRAERIDNNDVLEIYNRVSEAAAQIRLARSGPCFFECMTYRWKEHVGPNDDFHLGYRSKDEAEHWIRNDQLMRLGNLLDENARQAIQMKVETEIQEAFEFAEQSPFSDCDELYTDVFEEL